MTVTGSSSPLRQLRDGLSPIQRVAIDGVRYALEMAALSHWRLRHSLDLKSATLEEPLEPDFHTAIFLDAWSTVDSLHRLHQLLPPALPEACRDIPPEDAVSFEGAGSGSNCEAQDQQDLGPLR